MATKASHVDAQTELRKAFEVFDEDGSGTISASELRKVLCTLGENLNDAEIEELIQQADKDGDGTIDCGFLHASPTQSSHRLTRGLLR